MRGALHKETFMYLQVNSRASVLVLALLLFLSSTVSAQESQLGKVAFQTSGSEQARAHFLRGLAALHSFWYEEALEAFRESTTIEPDFAMGYWGEAMAYNHPLWAEQDTEAARAVLAKISDKPKITAREQAYLDAIRALYFGVNKEARDAAYSKAMEKIYRAYPEDLDAAAFYALSLLGITDYSDRSYRLQTKAGAIASAVFEKNPNHPGAAHYIIHAYDDPEHAKKALRAATLYAGIAPEAHHARHMPSHIFLQLGMWPEAAASNESAWEASEAWMKRKNLSTSVRDYHSLHWLLYVYLQQGRYSKAEELLTLMRNVMTDTTYENKLRPGYYESNYANMAAAFVVETERWDLAANLFEAIKISPKSGGEQSQTGTHGGHNPTQPATPTGTTVRTSNRNQTLPLFILGMAAAAKNDATARKNILELRAMSSGADADRVMSLQIMELEIEAVAASLKKEHRKAIEFMKRATFLEDEMGPPSGPPGLIKPTHELFGEILLRAGKALEAEKQFNTALANQPNRARSLLGLARAKVQSGDQTGAVMVYITLLGQWEKADEGLPELTEAREFLKKLKS
jgi:Tfp pilus assembly protein PilF